MQTSIAAWCVVVILGQTDQVDSLVGRVKNHPEPNERAEAARELGHLGKKGHVKKVLPALIEALKDPVPFVRERAAISIANMGLTGPDAAQGSLAVARLLKDEAISRGEGKTQILVSGGAASALFQMGEAAKEATPFLLEAAQSKDFLTRWFAIRALGRTSSFSKKVVPTLTRILQDPKQKDVHVTAVEALGGYPDESAQTIPLLWKIFESASTEDKDLNRMLKSGALGALGKLAIAGKPTLPRIAAIAADKSQDELHRSSALIIVQQMGAKAKESVPLVMKVFYDSRNPLCVRAMNALAAIGEPAIPALLEAIDKGKEPIRARAAMTLGYMGARAKWAIPVLTKMLKADPDHYVRMCAETALKRIQVQKCHGES